VTRLIAIDPGLKSGVAVFESGQLVEAFEVKPHETVLFTPLFTARKQYLGPPVSIQGHHARLISSVPPLTARKRCLETTVAIEDQYMGAGRAFKSIKTLIEIAGYWRLLAESYGMKTMRVNPRSWQASLKVKGQGNAKRAQCKRLSREYAVAIWGERAKAWTDNVSDAAHIGRWALVELAVKGRKK